MLADSNAAEVQGIQSQPNPAGLFHAAPAGRIHGAGMGDLTDRRQPTTRTDNTASA